jgi:hypothetical protein
VNSFDYRRYRRIVIRGEAFSLFVVVKFDLRKSGKLFRLEDLRKPAELVSFPLFIIRIAPETGCCRRSRCAEINGYPLPLPFVRGGVPCASNLPQ